MPTIAAADTPSPESLAWAQRLVRLDTRSDQSNLPLIECIADHLRTLQVPVRLTYDAERRKANLFATLGADEVRAAHIRTVDDVRRTPLLRLPGAALGVGCAELWLKLEQLQRGGSFKARGAFNRLRAQPLPSAGVVIASGGNAGIAAAEAARALGVRCEVFVPELASPAKRAALAALGAQVVVGGAAYADAAAACLRRQAATGALLLHAYDQPEVVAGAGTLALELEDEAGVPDRMLVSVGGGGLIAGVAAWWAGRCRVEALEPVG